MENISLSVPIQEFTVWFAYGSYDKLTVLISAPPGWNQAVWDPEPVLQDAGGYDALALAGV